MTDVEFLKIMLILGDAYENKNYELPPVLEKMIAYTVCFFNTEAEKAQIVYRGVKKHTRIC